MLFLCPGWYIRYCNDTYCAQQKTCCRIGGWNHHSGHRAIIFCDNCTPRSAIVFLTPGQLAGQMHTPRIHFKEHMHTEKTRLQHQIWPQKRGQFLDLQFAPFPIEGWFWGPLVGPRNGPRNSAFFLFLLPYHLGPNIWPAWPQLQRFSACQTGFTTKGSTCSKCPCTIIIICDQHSYCDCKHTHTQWGPTATKPEMLVFETPKTGLLKVSLRTHNHMLSTQLPRVQAYTHTQREGPWMQGMVSCKKKPPFLDLLRSMSAQHGETYKATFTVSGPWLRMWQWNSDEYSWH